ncbi:MAG: hypothetical protein R3B90_13910 [Planctomycetaceae bacterium]
MSVTLSRGFWLGQTEVTQGLWQSVMGTTPWSGQDYVKEGNRLSGDVCELGRRYGVLPEADVAGASGGRLPSGWSLHVADGGAVGVRLPGGDADGLQR